MKPAHTLVLLRHGETQYNVDKRFCGWTDVGMTEKGEADCRKAGELLGSKGFEFDVAYVSALKRSVKTATIVLEAMGSEDTRIVSNWRLNERHYGALQGQYHADVAKKYGAEQVFLWRRSFDVRPPALEKTDERYPGNDSKYKELSAEGLPTCESLKDTIARVLPFWEKEIAPAIKSGKRALVAAHGNSLRALVKRLDGISDSEIPKLEIPTGKPLIYELDKKLKQIKHYYLE